MLLTSGNSFLFVTLELLSRFCWQVCFQKSIVAPWGSLHVILFSSCMIFSIRPGSFVNAHCDIWLAAFFTNKITSPPLVIWMWQLGEWTSVTVSPIRTCNFSPSTMRRHTETSRDIERRSIIVVSVMLIESVWCLILTEIARNIIWIRFKGGKEVVNILSVYLFITIEEPSSFFV